MGQTLPVRSEAGKMCRFQENRAEMIDDENEALSFEQDGETGGGRALADCIRAKKRKWLSC